MSGLKPDEEAWLLDALARLVAARGSDPLASFPILEPTERCFPDPFDGGVRGARLIARRLLAYAGLRLEAEVHVDETKGPHGDRAAWFSGINLGRAVFGVYQGHLSDPDALVAALCHEVAHAYRAIHRLVVDDPDEEERLTDATTVFLGFGVLTTNGSYRFRRHGDMAQSGSSQHWLGYLPAQAMSFLLAAQAVARRSTGKGIARIARQLEPNQAGWFRSACFRLGKLDVGSRLGLPKVLPPPRELPEVPSHEDDRPAELSDLAHSRTARPMEKVGQIGFRVIRRQTFGTGWLALSLYLVIGLLVWVVVSRQGDSPSRAGLLLFLAGALAAWICGLAIGHRFRDDRCADCDGRLSLEATSCAGCGAALRGTLRNRNKRLAAREELEEQGPVAGLPSQD